MCLFFFKLFYLGVSLRVGLSVPAFIILQKQIIKSYTTIPHANEDKYNSPHICHFDEGEITQFTHQM